MWTTELEPIVPLTVPVQTRLIDYSTPSEPEAYLYSITIPWALGVCEDVGEEELGIYSLRA